MPRPCTMPACTMPGARHVLENVAWVRVAGRATEQALGLGLGNPGADITRTAKCYWMTEPQIIARRCTTYLSETIFVCAHAAHTDFCMHTYVSTCVHTYMTCIHDYTCSYGIHAPVARRLSDKHDFGMNL